MGLDHGLHTINQTHPNNEKEEKLKASKFRGGKKLYFSCLTESWKVEIRFADTAG